MTIRSLSAELAARKPKPKRAVIFDLDQVLIDSQSVDALRQQRKWGEVYSAIPRLPPFKGVEELMRLLSAAGVKVGLATARPKRYCELVAKRWKWTIDAMTTFEDRLPKKPAPDSLRACLERLGVTPDHAVAVCRDAQDVQAAKAAGLFDVAATWSAPENNGALSAAPRARCASPAELAQLLKRLFELG